MGKSYTSIQKREENGRMMLDLIDQGPLVYLTVLGKDGRTRPKKYSKLTEAQQLQDDCDVQETNIIFHDLPPNVYALVNHQELTDYGFHFDKIPIYCDTKAAIAISCNPVQHSRTKHIDVRYHFIKEKVEKGIVELFFVGTEYQLADLFTKALTIERFKYLVRRLGMRCLTPSELEALANESA
uniref:Ribonuclease H n=1 Tax=Tanacetum cinerariifolium TaxID=118510 RepID=A0A6L2MGX3_TANCI|nr:ribonuclease H [Tanacetum cinerariifolium]